MDIRHNAVDAPRGTSSLPGQSSFFPYLALSDSLCDVVHAAESTISISLPPLSPFSRWCPFMPLQSVMPSARLCVLQDIVGVSAAVHAG